MNRLAIGTILDLLSLLMPLGFSVSVIVLFQTIMEYTSGAKSFSPLLISTITLGQTMFLIGAFAFVVRKITEPYL